MIDTCNTCGHLILPIDQYVSFEVEFAEHKPSITVAIEELLL